MGVLEEKVVVTATTQGVKEAAAAVDKYVAGLLELATAQEQASAASEIISSAIKRVEVSGEGASAELLVLNKDLDRVAATMQKTYQEVQKGATAFDKLEGATAEQIVEVHKLVDATRELSDMQGLENAELHESTQKSEAAADAKRRHAVATEQLSLSLQEESIAEKSTADSVIRHATATKQLILEQDKQYQATRAVTQASQNLLTEEKQLELGLSETVVAMRAKKRVTEEMATAEERARHETRLYGVEVGKLKESLITAVAAGGVAGIVFKGLQIMGDGFRRATEAVKQFARESVEAFSLLQEEVARTKAQVPELIASQEELYMSTVQAARELGRGTLETQTAIRKAMNLGLDYNEAMEAVSVSTDAARVANADMTDTLISGMSTVNAYGTGVYDINEVLDQYAYLVQNSNLETQDLISGMAKIISPAAEAGISLEEVVSAMIVMNRQGDDFKEIGDLLGNTLTQIAVRGTVLSDAFEAAAGVGFREFTAAGGTLIEGLQLIEQHADATEVSVSELVQGNSKFYRDMLAGRGILELTGRHTKELEEAYNGAQTAQGTLSQQTEEFTGTLYLVNEQLESAKDRAEALQGMNLSSIANQWALLKTSFYDVLAGQSLASIIQSDLSEVLDTATELNNIRDLKTLVGLYDPDLSDKEKLANTKAIQEIIEETNDILFEQLVIEFEIYRLKQLALSGYKEELNIYQDISDIENLKDFDRKTKYQEENLILAKEQLALTEQEEQAAISAAAVAEQRAEWEGIIAERLAEQNDILVSSYETSQSFIQNVSDLQIDLGIATEPEEIEKIMAQLEEAGDAIDTHYRQVIIDSMIANNDFSESSIDLAVKLGLITKEAGELQKEFIKINIEAEALAKVKGFEDLNLEQQALAAERVAAGLMTAKEAVEQFDPSNWKEGVLPGIVKSEIGFVDPIINVRIPEADEAKLTKMEGQLEHITTSKWETWVYVQNFKAIGSLDELEEHIKLIVFDRTMTIYVDYQFSGGGDGSVGGGDSEFATGGSMTVPAGYNNDDYLIGVSSGEYVNVTPAGQSPSGGGGVNIEVINHFESGVHDSGRVAAASRDGLYQALEKAGLV